MRLSRRRDRSAADPVAVVPNVLFNHIRSRGSSAPSVIAAAPDQRGNLPETPGH